jgi:hypothetical protein
MKLTLPIISTLDNRPLQDIVKLTIRDKSVDSVDDISPLVSLNALILSNNLLGDGEGLAGIRHCSGLTQLELNGNEFTACPPGNHLNGMKLKVLNMSHNSIDRITHNFAQMSHSLAALVLNNNQLKVIDPSLFANCSNLNTLILSHNDISEFPLIPALRNLKTLAIAHNSLRVVPDISQYQSLKQLRLNNNKIISISMSHIQPMQTVWASLDLLDVGNNKITQDSLEALQQLRFLTNLNLKGNPIVSHYTPEDYQPTLTNLIPSLRILDGVRFDTAFLGRKQKRLALELKRRIKEQKAKPDGRIIKKSEVYKEPHKKETGAEKPSAEPAAKKKPSVKDKPSAKPVKEATKHEKERPSANLGKEKTPASKQLVKDIPSASTKLVKDKPATKDKSAKANKSSKPESIMDAGSKKRKAEVAVAPPVKRVKQAELQEDEDAHKSGVVAIIPAKEKQAVASFDPEQIPDSTGLNVGAWD